MDGRPFASGPPQANHHGLGVSWQALLLLALAGTQLLKHALHRASGQELAMTVCLRVAVPTVQHRTLCWYGGTTATRRAGRRWGSATARWRGWEGRLGEAAGIIKAAPPTKRWTHAFGGVCHPFRTATDTQASCRGGPVCQLTLTRPHPFTQFDTTRRKNWAAHKVRR